MRKVVSYLVCSVDGVVEDPQNWVFDRFDDEMLGHLQALIDDQDAVLLGRNTYEAWQPHWETSTHEPFASFINDTPKYVVSTTLDEVTWRNSKLIKGDLVEEVGQLKEGSGKSIGVHGSAQLVRSLVRDGLLDELKLAVFPAVAGRGAHLFEDFDLVKRLELVDAQPTAKGVVVLTYRPS